MLTPINDATEVEATVYLTVKGQRSRYGSGKVDFASVINSRQSKPPKLGKDEVAVKVGIRLPKSAFEALAPEAVIIVPESLIQRAEPEIEATDANATPEENR